MRATSSASDAAADVPSRRWLPRAVWPVVVVHGLLLVVTSVLYPTYRAPDETAHVDLVLTVAEEGYPPLEGPQLSEQVVRTRRLVGLPRLPVRNPPLSAAEVVPRDARPTFAQAGPDEPSGIPQQLSMHPPLYYQVAAAALAAATNVSPAAAWWSFDEVVGFLRLVSAAFVLPLPLLAAVATRVLTDRSELVLTAALLPLAVPMLTHIGASVNNDTLLVGLVGLVTVPGLAVGRGATRPGAAVVIGVLGGLALLTKGFALAVPVWIAAAYGLAALRRTEWPTPEPGTGERGWLSVTASGPTVQAAGSGALALGVAGVVGGWWWLRNLVVFGQLQPSGVNAPPAPPGFTPDVVSWTGFFVNRISERFWIEPEVVPDAVPGIDLVATFGLIVLVGVAVGAGNRFGVDRLSLALLLLLPLGLLGIVVFGSWRAYADTGRTLAIHGRYLYGGLVALAPPTAVGLALLVGGAWARRTANRPASGAATSSGGPCRWLPAWFGLVAGGVQLAAAVAVLARYWGPTKGLDGGSDLAALLAWSPWSPTLLALAVVALLAAVVWLGRWLLDEGRAGGTQPHRRHTATPAH